MNSTQAAGSRTPASTEELEARVALSLAVEPGDRRLCGLLRESTAAELVADPASWAKTSELARLSIDAARRAIDAARQHSMVPVLSGDEPWPASLDELPGMGSIGPAVPIMLWVRGDAALLSSPSVAITGARACTGYGAHVTTEIAAQLAAAGTAVLSGAAYGVDAAAHRAALAEDSPTIAVLAGGLDRPYPAGHAQLIERIAEHGALVSEMPPGLAPTRHRFIMRSRIIAALSRAVVVTEAGMRSGSLGVAQIAHGLGRPVGAVPGPVTSAASAGCHALIQQGTAQLVTSGADALALVSANSRTERAA
ncbi:DNA-processing protein DprA [Leucobacter luti]|uniref:DNA-processing protein DprA n=1 Tax=Leucobacter luti TaxID=340320 RepID=UPI003075B75D